MLRRLFLISVTLVLLAGIVPVGAQAKTFKVVFLLADWNDQGWNAAHYRGIVELKKLGQVTSENGPSFIVLLPDGRIVNVQVIPKVGYNDADIERVTRGALAQGANYVFGTWFDAKDAMARLAEEFPDVLFEHGSGYPLVKSNGRNFSTYFIRIEEGDYVAGYVAGLMGYTKVGIVATHQIPEPVRGVNAFAKGLQDGLKKAGKGSVAVDIQVVWIKAWLDREKESQATKTLLAQGYTVIRQMADTPTTSQTTCAADPGAVAFGYGSDVSPFAPCAIVTNEWNWGSYYVSRVKAALDGTWKSGDWWGGFADGAVVMEGWNKNVPHAVRKEAEALISQIIQGKFDPFCGPISGRGATKTGTVDITVPAGKCLSDDDLLLMQWLFANAKGELPPAPDGGFTLHLVDAKN